MDTSEKVRILTSEQGSTVKLTRNGDEVVSALIMNVSGDGDEAFCTFMDIHEGVERTLSVSDITDIAV